VQHFICPAVTMKRVSDRCCGLKNWTTFY